jgi:hypothetical protein
VFHSPNRSFYDEKESQNFSVNGIPTFVENSSVSREDTIPFCSESLDDLRKDFDTYGATSLLICHSGSDDCILKEIYIATKCSSVTVIIIPKSALANVNVSRDVLEVIVATDIFTIPYYTGGVSNGKLKLSGSSEKETFYSFRTEDLRALNDGRFLDMLGHHITMTHFSRVDRAYGLYYSFLKPKMISP